MRPGDFLLIMALLLTNAGFAKGNPDGLTGPDAAPVAPATRVEDMNAGGAMSPEVVPPKLVARDKILGTAYFNTLSILSASNECSDFFGGPANAVEVFTRFMDKVKKDAVRPVVGIQMTGNVVNIKSIATNAQYRLFDQVVINSVGPFYQRQFYNLRFRGVGSFGPNTREVRVLMLLHELGHMVKGDDGNWLLPNDGQDERISQLNSKRVESVCGKQINDLGKQDRDADQFSLAGKVQAHVSGGGKQLTSTSSKDVPIR